MPLNVALSMLRPERGARYRASYGWFLLVAAEALLVWFVFKIQNPDLSHWSVKSPPIPLVGRVAFAAGCATAV